MTKGMHHIISSLEEAEREALDALDRIRIALSILREDEASESETKEGMVVTLPSVSRKPRRGYREASVDDVLALVATGVETVAELKRHLPHATTSTIFKRLFELRRQGLIYDVPQQDIMKPNLWRPTSEAKTMNWIENRARELSVP